MFLSFSCDRSYIMPDCLGVTEHRLGDYCVDEFNDGCLLEGSSCDYSEAYFNSNKLRPSEWIKKIVLIADTSVYANQCLMYSWLNSSYLVGDALNWIPRNCPTDHPHNILSNPSASGNYTSFAEGIIFQSRGFRVYGHWLLDYLPRLLLIKEYCKSFPDLPIIVRNIPQWAKVFIYRLGITNPIVNIPQGGEFRISLLHIPLIMKEGSAYFEPLLAESFFTIRQLFASFNSLDKSAFPKKIFFARSKPPFALNQDEAIDFYTKRGFHCVYPELLSLEEQISMFSCCRAFVGEDSSAMHNIGFAAGSSSLIFSRMNRINLWHAAVASATGQYIRPVQSKILARDGKYQIPLDDELLVGL